MQAWIQLYKRPEMRGFWRVPIPGSQPSRGFSFGTVANGTQSGHWGAVGRARRAAGSQLSVTRLTR